MLHAGWDRTTVQVLELLLSSESLKGRTIGLCNEKLKVMSGEEVESMEQGTLAAQVRQVSSPRGRQGRDGRGLHLLCPLMALDSVFQVSIFFRTSPKHKVKIIKVTGLKD